jgi:predicted AAA+ superfamily ATPase
MSQRHLLPFLNKSLAMFPAVAVVGARQVGKTTLLGAVPGEWQHYDMEVQSDRGQVIGDPDLFLRLASGSVAIDEAQLAPSLFPALRVAIDRNRAQKGLYLLSGSSSPDLVKSIAESLSGRIAMLELGPFSLAEAFSQSASPIYQLIATRAGIDALLTAASPRIPLAQVLEYWFNGGYPEPWLSNDDDFRRLWQRNYLDTYLLRDIGSLFPGLNRDRYRQFIQLLANVSGTLLNNAEIARTLGVSEPTVRDWLWIAHGTFIWRHIPAWDRSPHKQLVRHPKGYLRDSGVLHRLLQIPSQDHLASHVVNGRSWEGMIVEQLLRGLESAGYRASPFHYRTRGGAEIDLILQGDFGILPVEIKLSSSSPRRDWTALREFVETHQCAYGIVINNDERPRQLDDRILSIPAAAL